MTTDAALLRRLGDLLLEAGAVVHQMADQAEQAPPPALAAEVTFDAWMPAARSSCSSTAASTTARRPWPQASP